MRTYMALLKRNKQRLAEAYAKHNAKLNGSKGADTKDNLSAATSMSAANTAAPTNEPTVTVNAGGTCGRPSSWFCLQP